MIAYIFKRRRTYNGKNEASQSYHARYKLDGEYRICETNLRTSDKQVAEKRLTELICEKERERAGIIAPKLQRDAATKPLTEHLEDFLADLRALGRSNTHTSHLRMRIRRQLEQCGWKHVSDISADRYTAWRAGQHDIGPRTINEYLNSFNMLLNWMVRQGRIVSNPLTRIIKVDIRGKQQKRRAFTDEELERLIAVSPKRRLVYLTAAYTGLRIGELRQLVWADLKLDCERPCLVARAETTKNRHQAVIPLHPKLVEGFKELSEAPHTPDAAVFLECANSDRFIRNDLEKAGIPRIDETGRKLDFHALRYTFATKLAARGVSMRLAQELMRHSDPRLTANIYTDVTQLPTYEAVKNLPWVEKETKPEPETANFGPVIRTQKSVTLGQNASETVAVAKNVKSPEAPDSAASRPVFSRPVTQGQLAERGRFEYYLDWLLYAFGSPQQPEPPREVEEGAFARLYQVFCLEAMIAWPADLFGDMLAENRHGRANGFFPTPHSLVELMTKLTFGGGGDHRLQTVYDSCTGTGRMLLHASNHSYRLFGQDINTTVLKACAVNAYCFAPWMVRPFPFLKDDTVESVAPVALPEPAPILIHEPVANPAPKPLKQPEPAQLTLFDF